jgi:hypothetical protein
MSENESTAQEAQDARPQRLGHCRLDDDFIVQDAGEKLVVFVAFERREILGEFVPVEVEVEVEVRVRVRVSVGVGVRVLR